jgi:hypothetical protein
MDKPVWNKGKKVEEDDKVKCPYCDKTISKPMAKRWHFENCKYKT